MPGLRPERRLLVVVRPLLVSEEEILNVSQLDQALRQFNDLNRRMAARLGAPARPAGSSEARLGLRFHPGEKAFDLVTGQEVEIIAGSTAHSIVPTARGPQR